MTDKPTTQPSGENSVTIFLLLLIIVVGITMAGRYYQRAINVTVKSQKGSRYADLSIDTSLTHHVLLIRSFPNHTNWHNLIREAPSKDLDSPEITRRIKLFFYYDLLSSEKRYLQFLSEQPSTEKEKMNVLGSHLLDYIPRDFTELFDTGQYEKARYRAQGYINFVSSLSASAYTSASPTLARARAVVEFSQGAFPYSDRYVEDRRRYDTIARKYKKSDSPLQIREWEQFIRDFPQSIKVDEAAINIIYYSMNKLGVRPDTRKDIRNTLLEFAKKYPESYLADDALWYALKLSVELLDANHVVAIFDKLVREYKQSDHTKRLRHELALWLKNDRVPQEDISSSLVEFMFSLPVRTGGQFQNFLHSQFSSSIEREKLQHTIIFLIDKFDEKSNQRTPRTFMELRTHHFLAAVLFSWVSATN